MSSGEWESLIFCMRNTINILLSLVWPEIRCDNNMLQLSTNHLQLCAGWGECGVVVVMFYLNIYDTTMLIRAAITFYSGHKTFEINNKAGTGVARVEAARIWGEGAGGYWKVLWTSYSLYSTTFTLYSITLQIFFLFYFCSLPTKLSNGVSMELGFL